MVTFLVDGSTYLELNASKENPQQYQQQQNTATITDRVVLRSEEQRKIYSSGWIS